MNSNEPNESVEVLAWPLCRLGEAMETLARVSGLAPRPVEMPPPSPNLIPGEQLNAWIDSAAAWLGFEVEPVDTSYPELDQFICRAAPALFLLPATNEARFLALLRRGKRRVTLLGPDLRPYRVSSETVQAALCRELEAPLTADVDRVLTEAGVDRSRWFHARKAILKEQLSARRISDCWLLRLSPGANVWKLARQGCLIPRLAVLAGAHALQYALWILSWWLIGQGALQGRIDWGWLLAWALLLFSLVPFRLFVTWSQGVVALLAGAILKQRLLCGALRLEPEEIRHQGIGQLLGRVIESEAVESLALSGGFLGLFATIELAVALLVLGAGARGWWHVLLLVIWTGAACLIGWHYFRRRRQWTEQRIVMTNDLVERMVGHRTRLAQEARERWHDGEDQKMERYLTVSELMDRRAARLIALVPRGWLILGLAGLTPAFVLGEIAPAALAVSLGGILLAYRALQKLAAGLWHLSDAVIAWRQLAPLFHAAARPKTIGSPSLFANRFQGSGRQNGQPLVEARDLIFRYRDRGEAVLRGCNLRIHSGDRLLLEGSSGGGKSTFASLLAGLRLPASGLLLLDGLDLESLGEIHWRQRVGAAPQFHENHVLTGTFAFNVLMGRRWPPLPQDLEQAERICRELGLEDLLKRMPAGLLQMVGETGWQLSQGEKSRLYIARALLQGAGLVSLDESFASLDPENLRRAMRCVLERAPTLLVIAHP